MSTKRSGGRVARWFGVAAYLSLIGMVGLVYFDVLGALATGVLA